MRVQTDEGKIPSGKSPESQVQPQPVKMANQEATIDYQTTIDYHNLLPREERHESTTIRCCKNVLLFVAIAAFSLACLVFIRDLWMTEGLDKTEVLHPHPMVSSDSPTSFPMIGEMLKDFGMNTANTLEPDGKGKVISQTTRITFRMSPNNGLETSDDSGPDEGEQQILDDALKMMMGDMAEKPVGRQFFGNFPFFSGPSSPVHPKLIIVKKINPSIFPANQDSLLKSMLDAPEASSDDSKSDTFPLSIRRNPVSIFSPFSLVRPVKPTNSLEEYEKIISEMDSSSAKILNHTIDLEELVKHELEKATQENTKDANTQSLDFLSSASANLKKFDANLRLAREIIERERENLKSATDYAQNLAVRVKSYHSALRIPLSGVFEAAVDLTNNTGDMKIVEPIFERIISLGRELINFGKLMYEDIKDLEDRLDQNGQELDQIFNLPPRPVVHRRLIIFRTPPAPEIQKSDPPKEEIPVENAESKKVE